MLTSRERKSEREFGLYEGKEMVPVKKKQKKANKMFFKGILDILGIKRLNFSKECKV